MGNSLISSLTELQYFVFTLIFEASVRMQVNLTLFGNLPCNVFVKYGSTHIKEMFMLCLLWNWMYARDKVSFQI